MPRIATYGLSICAVVFVSACSSPEPEPVRIAPNVDKLGNASCPSGTVLAQDGETGVQFCAPTSSI